MVPLEIYSEAELLALDVEELGFIVDRLLPSVGLHMLAGGTKIGKSWLALWLCHQIALGEPIWGFETKRCGVLYLALEDYKNRLVSRLHKMVEVASQGYFLATDAAVLSGSLLEQLALHLQTYPDTGLIVIDTFQRIRGLESSGYANDYEDTVLLKEFAYRHNISILLLHHVRKLGDSNPFNTVSGTNGISGGVDSTYVLKVSNRAAHRAILYTTGRDIEEMRLPLELAEFKWELAPSEEDESTDDALATAIDALLDDKGTFTGTASELLDELNEYEDLSITASILARTLKTNEEWYSEHLGVSVKLNRSKKSRSITLDRVSN
ncbi:hypothetical protein FACS1894184_16760 [Clostridia bacterium]|nr:hypothetical protein FACS1894184_16760 [Clostridia bacterium]